MVGETMSRIEQSFVRIADETVKPAFNSSTMITTISFRFQTLKHWANLLRWD